MAAGTRPPAPAARPEALAKGEPGAGYPHPWSIYAWLEGRTASADEIADPVRLAIGLAGFLSALQGIDPTGGPSPGLHNWYRGGTLRTYDAVTRDALAALRGQVDVDLAEEIWESALDARWDGTEVWFHGDMAQGNLLLDRGELSGVLDFGTCGVGDPACDMAIAWTLLTEAGRQAFRDRLSVDETTWARGRGWALWKALVTCSRALGDDDEEVAAQQRVLDQILADYLRDG